MLARLDEQIQNDPNTAKINLLLLGIIQHVSSIKESQINMHCDLKVDIQKITSNKEDVTMEMIETTVKQSVSSTLVKLGQCMATFEVDDCMEMAKFMEEIEVEGTSAYDGQYITTTSTSDNEIGDKVYTVPKTFPGVELIMVDWYKYAVVNKKRNSSK